jgi:hypothetical protein
MKTQAQEPEQLSYPYFSILHYAYSVPPFLLQEGSKKTPATLKLFISKCS